MKILEVIKHLETFAPPVLQESYDNSGLLAGDGDWECTGILVTLDSTEEVIIEAIEKGCNLVVAHHPIIFGGLKKLNGKNYVEKTIIKSIKHDIAIYAIHTNLDNIKTGVNARMAEKLGLVNCKVLLPKGDLLRKLAVYVPEKHAEAVRTAVFKAGAGNVGHYSECSFNIPGTTTFKPGEETHPFIGTPGKMEESSEIKIEVLYPAWLEGQILNAMINAHPYEEVAYDIISLINPFQDTGSGMIGELKEPIEDKDFLNLIADVFKLKVIKHSRLTKTKIKKVALCGGAGSFLINKALDAEVDMYITADMKYHEYFDANEKIILVDIGHYESEQYTIDLLYEIIHEKYPTFAVQKTETQTNPVNYHFNHSSA